MIENIEVIDAHMHYGYGLTIAKEVAVPYLKFGDPSTVEQCMDRYDTDRAVLMPPDRLLAPLTIESSFDYSDYNEAVSSAVRKSGGRLIGMARINPRFSADHVEKQLEFCARNLGLKGVKLLGRVDLFRSCDLNVLEPVMRKAKQHGLVVLFHSGHPPYDLPSLQAHVAENYPEVKFVIAHMGTHEFFWEALIAAKKNDNIWCDMSGNLDVFDIKIFVKEVGADKLLYGSDAPVYSPRVAQVKLRESSLKNSEMELILNENAKTVWGFK